MDQSLTISELKDLLEERVKDLISQINILTERVKSLEELEEHVKKLENHFLL